MGEDSIEVKSRYEKERLDYLTRYLDFNKKRILDIGGNTGYFTFEMIELGASCVHHYEGSKYHSEFVRLASEYLNCDDRIITTNKYYCFDNTDGDKYQITLLLNVLHHLGDDYGNKNLSIEKAKILMLDQLNYMSDKTDEIVFQLGFCWKGNRNDGLFTNGTKKELIDFITEGTRKKWDILHIGIPVLCNRVIKYQDLNERSIVRDDSLGEFLNRPLFIMRSKLS